MKTFKNHFIFSFLQRFHTIKRSSSFGFISILLTFICLKVSFTIINDFRDSMNNKYGSLTDLMESDTFRYSIVYINNSQNMRVFQRFTDILSNLLYEKTEKKPLEYVFDSIFYMRDYAYANLLNTGDTGLDIGFVFSNNTDDGHYTIDFLINRHKFSKVNYLRSIKVMEQIQKIFWQSLTNNSYYQPSSVVFEDDDVQETFFKFGALISSVTVFFAYTSSLQYHTILYRVNVKWYLESCKINVIAFWLGCFVIDFAFWIAYIIECSLLSYIFDYVKGSNYNDMLLVLLLYGPSFMMLLYCLSFLFKSQISGVTFNSIIIFLADGAISFLFSNNHYIIGLYPLTCLKSFVTGKISRRLAVTFLIIDIPIYFLILILIEITRSYILAKRDTSDFLVYQALFERRRNQQNIDPSLTTPIDTFDTDYVVKCVDVCKIFFDSEDYPHPVVNKVSFGIRKGEVYGLLGANGAGKTTLMKMITGILGVSHGTIEVCGTDVHKVGRQQLISLCPQENTHMAQQMSPVKLIKIFGRLFDTPAHIVRYFIDELIPLLHLSEDKDKMLSNMSGGSCRKVAFLISLLSPAKIVILDEPTSSLDPFSRKVVHKIIKQMKNEKTFILCTHLLNEAEELCDNLSILINGCSYASGNPFNLTKSIGTYFKLEILIRNRSSINRIKGFISESFPSSNIVFEGENSIEYSIPRSIGVADVMEKMKEASELDIGIEDFNCFSCSLEKAFMELVSMSNLHN